MGIGRRRLRGFVATTCPCALPERSTGIRRGRDSRGVSRDFSRTGRSRCLQWNRHCARTWADGCSTRRDLGSRGATRRVVSQVHRLGTGWLKRRPESDHALERPRMISASHRLSGAWFARGGECGLRWCRAGRISRKTVFNGEGAGARPLRGRFLQQGSATAGVMRARLG